MNVFEKAALTYGSKIYMLNRWNHNSGGFLDTRGYCRDFKPEIGNLLCVSTAESNNRDNGSGTWKILSASGKPEGAPVMANDRIHLQNGWNNFGGGFLDTRGYCKDFEPKIGNLLCVSTAQSNNRDNGSGTWIVNPVIEDMPVLLAGQPITLQNGWNGNSGGFLDTRGYGKDFEPKIGNLLCVSTAQVNNRDSGSGAWLFFSA